MKTHLDKLKKNHEELISLCQSIEKANTLHEKTELMIETWEKLSQAMRFEEEILLPSWARVTRVDDKLVTRIATDHLYLRKELSRALDDELFEDEINHFASFLKDHLLFEEEHLLKIIETKLSNTELSYLDASEAKTRM